MKLEAGSKGPGAGSIAPACADAVAGELSIEIRQRWAEIHGGINPLHADREQFGRFLLYLTQLANGRLVVLHRPSAQPGKHTPLTTG